jgi:hypothetical protein
MTIWTTASLLCLTTAVTLSWADAIGMKAMSKRERKEAALHGRNRIKPPPETPSANNEK